MGSFGYAPVNKSKQYVLDNQLGLLREISGMKNKIKADTMCYLIH